MQLGEHLLFLPWPLQAAHPDEREGAAIAKLNLAAGVGLVEGAELHVGGGHQVSVVESLRAGVKIG